MPDLPSLHDLHLVAYRVDCRRRELTLEAESAAGTRPPEKLSVLFSGVDGYRLEDDAFGNIIFELEELPAVELYEQEQEAIQESYRRAGSPGPWASSVDTARAHLEGDGIRAFRLASSIGLSGWVLARQIGVQRGGG